MDIKYNIGPQFEKMNVIVEGVTDGMYLTAMMHYLSVDEAKRPNIIPCVGVDAVHLMVSILIGWGCNYKVVVDYDTQGYLSIRTDRFSVSDIVGRTVVIHSDPDDFHSLPAGNAGMKIGCGVIYKRR